MTTTMKKKDPFANPAFKPSESYSKIEAETAARMARMEAEGKEPPAKLEPPDDGPPLKEFLDALCARHGVPPPLPGMTETLMAQIKAEYKAENLAMVQAQYEAAWKAVTPVKFREEWDWKKCPEEICTAEKKAALKMINEWQFGPRGLYIAGYTGHCKSRVVFRLLKRLMVKERREVMVLDGAAFSNLMTRAFGKPDETEDILRKVCRVPLLVIDDMGKRWTPATEEGAFTVIDRRTANDLPIIVTLNYTGQDLLDMQAARGELAQLRDVATPLVRRLVDYCTPVVL